jgi:hypothetical protein
MNRITGDFRCGEEFQFTAPPPTWKPSNTYASQLEFARRRDDDR